MDEFIVDIKAALRERVSSPLIVSFVVSWCLWNWRFLVILFSEASVTNTFLLVDSISFSGDKVFYNGIVYPLLTSLCYVFLYPWPALLEYKYRLFVQRKIRDVKQKFEGSILLSKDESILIMANMREAKDKHKKEVDELIAVNADLQHKLNELSGFVHPDRLKKIEPEVSDLSHSQIDIMRVLDDFEGVVSESGLYSAIDSGSKVQDAFDVNELIRLGLIEKIYDQDYHEPMIGFTHDGRRFWLNVKKTKS